MYEQFNGFVMEATGGKVGANQVIACVVAVVVAIVLAKLIKGVFKAVALVAVSVILCIYFGIATPEQIQEYAGVTMDKVAQMAESVKGTIDGSVKFEDGKVMLKTSEGWTCLDDVVSFTKDSATNAIKIITKDGEVVPDGEECMEFLSDLYNATH